MADQKSREQRIREEAHLLWNAEGRPEGKPDDYWLAAEKVIDHQDRLAAEEDAKENR
jgi:hypothetical protein